MIDPRGARSRTHFMFRRFRTCSPSISGAGRKVNRSTSSCPRRRAAPDCSSAARIGVMRVAAEMGQETLHDGQDQGLLREAQPAEERLEAGPRPEVFLTIAGRLA